MRSRNIQHIWIWEEGAMVIGAYKPAFVDLVIETVAEHNLVLKTPR